MNNLIEDCLQSVADIFVNDSEIDIKWNFGIDKEFDFPLWEIIFNKYGIKPKKLSFSIGDNYYKTCEAMWGELNYKYNQEFLRMRTSGMYSYGSGGGVYFRVSSFEYNWFNDIWKICATHRGWISDVTIVADSQAGKSIGTDYYVISGMKMKNVPTNEFLMLSGNPIVESFDNEQLIKLHKGCMLDEALCDYGSFHNVNRYRTYQKLYIRDNFENVPLTNEQLKIREFLTRFLLENKSAYNRHSMSIGKLLNKLDIHGECTQISDCSHTVLLRWRDSKCLVEKMENSKLFHSVKNDGECVEYIFEDQYLLEVFNDRLVIVEFGG